MNMRAQITVRIRSVSLKLESGSARAKTPILLKFCELGDVLESVWSLVTCHNLKARTQSCGFSSGRREKTKKRKMKISHWPLKKWKKHFFLFRHGLVLPFVWPSLSWPLQLMSCLVLAFVVVHPWIYPNRDLYFLRTFAKNSSMRFVCILHQMFE